MPKVCAVSSCNKKETKLKRGQKTLIKRQKQKLHFTGKDYSENVTKTKLFVYFFYKYKHFTNTYK